MLEANQPVSPNVARAIFATRSIPEVLQAEFWLNVYPAKRDKHGYIIGRFVNAYVEDNRN